LTEGIRRGNEALLRRHEIPVAPSIEEGLFFMAKKPQIRTPLHDLAAKAVAGHMRRSGILGYITLPKMTGNTRTVIAADKDLFNKLMRKLNVPEHLHEAARQAILRHEIHETLSATEAADRLSADLGRILPGIREGKSSRELIATLANAAHNYFKSRTFSHFGPEVLEREAEMVATAPPEIQKLFIKMRKLSGENKAWRRAIDTMYPYIPASKRRELREYLSGFHPSSLGAEMLRNATLSFTSRHPNVTGALDSALRIARRFIPK